MSSAFRSFTQQHDIVQLLRVCYSCTCARPSVGDAVGSAIGVCASFVHLILYLAEVWDLMFACCSASVPRKYHSMFSKVPRFRSILLQPSAHILCISTPYYLSNQVRALPIHNCSHDSLLTIGRRWQVLSPWTISEEQQLCSGCKHGQLHCTPPFPAVLL